MADKATTERWIDIAPAHSIQHGAYRIVQLNDKDIAVYNIGGEFLAIEDLCTHDYTGLSGGDICGYRLICPRHGAAFDLRTGAVLTPPATDDIATFATRVSDGVVQLNASGA
ncbi:MAG: Rieske 2Fe-2S domain-containing protein [Gammaproteobacteria bacterium]|nr:Rieske 2Fe-2S domain-containing protein [Gammaproteobacteria bacterium]